MSHRYPLRVLLAVAIAAAVAAPAGALTWPVGDPDSLQSIVDSAAYGDTVLVAPGEYVRVILRSGIRLIAEAGPDETIFRNGRFWCVKADGVDTTAVLEGFTLDGAKAAEGLVTADNSFFLVRDCVLRDAWSGIRAMYSDLRIENCTIRDCQNGIYLFESGGLIRDNDIRNCINGINFVSSSPRVIRNEIAGNSIGLSLSEHSDPRIGGSLATANRIRDNRGGNVLNRALEKRFSVRTMKPMTLEIPYNYWGSDCPDSLGFRGPVVWAPWVDETGTRSLDECSTPPNE
jgi:parallel beta-helix repeat protein